MKKSMKKSMKQTRLIKKGGAPGVKFNSAYIHFIFTYDMLIHMKEPYRTSFTPFNI